MSNYLRDRPQLLAYARPGEHGHRDAFDYVVIRLGVDAVWTTLVAATLTVVAFLVITSKPVLAAPMEAVTKRMGCDGRQAL